ncbi:hypothetical protein SAMN05444064_12662 [Pseudomonas syringae]|nr:hypothetical protein SAMN05444514_116102 [Pseudomonas syringae]SFM69964.1 hypothetical protein SAMN05444064_12662 [Pseudomonas syringae]
MKELLRDLFYFKGSVMEASYVAVTLQSHSRAELADA